MKNLEVVAPNNKVFGTADTWIEAVDKAVDLSLRWGVLFRVRRMTEAKLPFQRERMQVLQRSIEYVERSRLMPGTFAAEMARVRFENSKRKLDFCLTAYAELQGSDLVERHRLSHPIKAHRTV